MIVKSAEKLELFEVDVLNGRLPIGYSNTIRAALEAMNGFKVDITIKKWRKNRTSKQNRYLQSAIYPAISDRVYELTGERYKDNDACADEVKTAIGWVELETKIKWCEDSNQFITVEEYVPRRSNNLNTLDFQQYCDKIRKWAFEFLDINICDPDGNPWAVNY